MVAQTVNATGLIQQASRAFLHDINIAAAAGRKGGEAQREGFHQRHAARLVLRGDDDEMAIAQGIGDLISHTS